MKPTMVADISDSHVAPTTGRWSDRAAWAFVAMDLALGALYLGNFALREPSWEFTRWVDLNGEGNLPSYYSATQLFVVALSLAVFAWKRFDLTLRQSWLLWMLPALLLVMSLDEGAKVHEPVGRTMSRLVFGARINTPWKTTTGWMVVLCPPFALAATGVFLSVRRQLAGAPGALSRLTLGLVVLLLGAVGVESLSNIFAGNRTPLMLMICLEETLEMLGASIMLWAAMGLLEAQGFRIVMRESRDRPQP